MVRQIVVSSLLALLGTVASAVTPGLPRHPAPSPDGTTIAFSWQGDLWLGPSAGGSARRLTANPGYDHSPAWLGGGQRLVFASDREGGNDVFVADLPDGAPRRLTFHEASDTPMGGLGEDVVFVSRRHEAWDRQPAVYGIPVSGGTERLLAKVLALEAVPSPDGRSLALVRGATPAERRHYRGAANRDLWLLDVASGALQRLTETAWDEDGVSWAGDGALVFRSDNGGSDRNVFRLDVADRKLTQLTRHQGSDVRRPRASANGRIVAYELWDSLWTVPGDGSAEPQRLALDVPADVLEPEVERSASRDDAEEVAPSPDGKQVALVVRGDVFVVARRGKDLASVAGAPTVRVTATPARERDVTWSPDGKTLVYASDRAGQYDLYRARPEGRSDGSFVRATTCAETRLTDTPIDERQPQVSPDGKLLAFVVGKGGLATATADGGNVKVLFEHWEKIGFAFSPDSRWLAYSRQDAWYNSEVFVVPAQGGEAVNVSQHPGTDIAPQWSPDGRRLYWLSKRHARTMDLWAVYLTRADEERTQEEWLQLFEDEDEKDRDKDKDPASGGKPGDTSRAGGSSKGPGNGIKKEPRPVAIDFERIHERARALTSLPGDEGAFAVAPDGKTVVFAAAPEGEEDLYKVRWDGKELARLTTKGVEPGQVAFLKGGKNVLYRTGKGTVGVVDLDGKAGDPVSFEARSVVDRAALRAQVFDEAWREMDRWFYDPAFHGVDWTALRGRYRGLAQAASTARDFADVMSLMLGELNSSHQGFRLPRRGGQAQTGELGVEIAPAPDGNGVVVTEVLPETPAARVDAGLAAGDRIVAVGGEEITRATNFFAPLAQTVGQRVVLRVVSGGKERDVVLTACKLGDATEARYRAWVRERRAIAERLSGGRLGYVHIQGMSEPSLEEFERDLFAAAHGKQGLLIDVRNNGGGWTTDMLMAILSVRRHAWTVPRDGDPTVKAYPDAERLPLPAWTRPAATLCDESSYSNAEIFSWAFQTLKRGPVVGQRTFGAVISTDGAGLVDGSFVRLPSRGWYVAGSGVNEENNGCVPDVVVEQPPQQDLAADDDTQLARAVEVLLARLPEKASDLPW